MLGSRIPMPRPARLFVLIVVVYAFCWIKGWPRYYDDEELPPTKRRYAHTALGPHTVTHDQIAVSITTTATNVYTKVAPLLVYLDEADKDSLVIFSDLQTDIGKWPVFDVLWRYPRDFIIGSDELARYRAQVDYARGSLPVQRLKKQDAREEARIIAAMAKYKVLQSMAAMWEYRPERKWYIFVDDETYVNRPNLMDWLAQYDPEETNFFGNSPQPEVPDQFATGGSSFILSGKAMKELFGDRKNLIKSWQPYIKEYPSALQLVITLVEMELKVSMGTLWPGSTGFSPSNIPFSPTLWCEPVVMMHGVEAEQASELLKVERERVDDLQNHIPMRVADLWDQFLMPEDLNYIRDDWDNLSSEPSNSRWNIVPIEGENDPAIMLSGEESAEGCLERCERTEFCMQWSYSSMPQSNWNGNPETKCHLSSSVRFGKYVEPKEIIEAGEEIIMEWKSGWRKERFTDWANYQRCKAQHQR